MYYILDFTGSRYYWMYVGWPPAALPMQQLIHILDFSGGMQDGHLTWCIPHADIVKSHWISVYSKELEYCLAKERLTNKKNAPFQRALEQPYFDMHDIMALKLARGTKVPGNLPHVLVYLRNDNCQIQSFERGVG